MYVYIIYIYIYIYIYILAVAARVAKPHSTPPSFDVLESKSTICPGLYLFYILCLHIYILI